ncbi:hypothetical protein [Pectinatus frisingensis]|uniref:hypothetical protein n=1 Tax=Pectinatus frisingensis TaxID=865 RepID=UPI0018C4C0C2|nr:hypothetical protein [Pectinatus frisingensis]
MAMTETEVDRLCDFVLNHRVYIALENVCTNFLKNHMNMYKRIIPDNIFYEDSIVKNNKYDFGSDFRYGKYKKSDLIREIIGSDKFKKGDFLIDIKEYKAIFVNGFADKICAFYNKEIDQRAKSGSTRNNKIPTFNSIKENYDETIKQQTIEKMILYCKLIKFFYKKKQTRISLFNKDGSKFNEMGYNVLANELIPSMYAEIDSSFILYELSLKTMIDTIINSYKKFYDLAIYAKRIGNEPLAVNIDDIINMMDEIKKNIRLLYTDIDRKFNNTSNISLHFPFKVITEAEKLYISTKLMIYRHINDCHKEAFKTFRKVIKKYKDVGRGSYKSILDIPDNKEIYIGDNSAEIDKSIGYIFHYYRKFFDDYFTPSVARDLKTPFIRTVQWIRYQYGEIDNSFKLKYVLLYLRVFLFIKKNIPDFDIFYVLGQLKKIHADRDKNNYINNISERDIYLLNLTNIFAIESISPGINNLAFTYYLGIYSENQIKDILYRNIYTYLNSGLTFTNITNNILILGEAFTQFYKNILDNQ